MWLGIFASVFVLALLVLLLLILPWSVPGTPSLVKTLTPQSQGTPLELGSFERLDRHITLNEARTLSPDQLSADTGAIEITEELLETGRDAFYQETYGNEVFFTDVLGTIDGPINLWTVSRATMGLWGRGTTNLQIRLDKDVTIGDQTFPRGTRLNTGLDVPPGWLVPLGMKLFSGGGQLRIGVSCALCHAAVDEETGKIIEGAPNADLDTGLILAFATNSAAFFRQTGVNPLSVGPGGKAFNSSDGSTQTLPDITAFENAVDTDLLAWAPGNFDSTGDVVNNPTQVPTSYTFGAHPYGWSGFASVGYFDGLTTLNNNVHATNSDMTTGADSSFPLLGIPKDVYLGAIFQNAPNRDYRLPEGENPSWFFERVDPTPGNPGMNRTVPLPGYPQASIFMVDGLMANTPGFTIGEQLNGMSAFQHRLSPPPVDLETTSIQRGADVFVQAGCQECHRGRYFTNNLVLPQQQMGTQPSRAKALAAFPRIFTEPRTYAPDTPVPMPENPRVLDVPLDRAPQQNRDLAYAIGKAAGGYKVSSLIGLAVSAPYLHDGGVAAGEDALQRNEDGTVQLVSPERLGLPGTLLQGQPVSAANSLHVLVDRELRELAVNANRSDVSLQRSNTDGSGHEFWVDEAAGFNQQEQTDLVNFLLSLDDSPEVLLAGND